MSFTLQEHIVHHSVLGVGTGGTTNSGVTVGAGWIKCTDVSVSGGTTTNKIYQDTGNTVLQSATVSDLDATFTVASSYPLVTVGGANDTLTVAADGGHYSGDVDVTLSGVGDVTLVCITPDGALGAQDTVAVSLDPPPSILTLSFTGGYPGSQTQLKAGDSFQITGTTDKDIDAVDIQAFGAFDASLEAVATDTTFTVTGTVADQGTSTQALAARIRVRDDVTGAYSSTRDTDFGGGTTDGVDLVNLNNTYPTATWGSPSYPVTQSALKNSEQATVPITLADLDTVSFTSPNSQLSITNPSTIETPKTVTRIAGDYNIDTNNLRAVANRAANDATTTSNTVVKIAHVSAEIQVTEPATRLRSGGNDGTAVQDHTITITSNQQLGSAPTMDEDTGGGTFTGSWSGGPTVYTRTLEVDDDDTKGTYTWQNLSATNLAGLVTTAITGDADYVLGGFVQRSLTFAAFSQSTTMNVAVVDYTKVQAGIFTATNQAAVRHSPQGDQADATDEYTILSPLSTNPQTLWWNDQTAASANSGGTAQITNVEEIA